MERTVQEQKPLSFSKIANLFNTRDFTIKRISGDDEVVFATGTFVHEVKSTRRLFKSDWAQVCLIRDKR